MDFIKSKKKNDEIQCMQKYYLVPDHSAGRLQCIAHQISWIFTAQCQFRHTQSGYCMISIVDNVDALIKTRIMIFYFNQIILIGFMGSHKAHMIPVHTNVPDILIWIPVGIRHALDRLSRALYRQ